MDALPHVDDAPRPALSRADPAAESGPVTAKTATVERRSSAAPWITVPVLAAALAVIGVVAVHMSTAASIVSIWMRSETFAHGFVIVPICLWLIWRKREALAEVPAAPWWPGLLVVAGAGAMWFVTSVADVLGLKQFALAFMIQAAFVTVVGLSVARTLAFPLAFLLFAVPVGEIFVPTLIEWTADFTVAALRAVGRAGLPRRQPLRHPVGRVVGGRGVQRHPLHHRFGDDRHHLRGASPTAVRAGARCSSPRRS